MAREKRYSTDFNDESLTLTKELTDGRTVRVSFNDLPAVSQKHIIGYGLTQLLNDCHSGETELDEIFRLSELKAKDLLAGDLRRRSGLGLGVDFDLLCEAVARASDKIADAEAAKQILSQFIPGEDDDEDTIKQKKAKIRQIANQGSVKVHLDELRGRTVEDVLGL